MDQISSEKYIDIIDLLMNLAKENSQISEKVVTTTEGSKKLKYLTEFC